MKYPALALISALSLFATGAQAANEGPHGAPKPPTDTTSPVLLAGFDNYAGFGPPGHAQSWGVKLYSNGVVKAYQDKNVVTVARLSASVTQKLAETFAAVQGGNLVDPDQGKPMCTDAPGSSLKVVQHGTELVVARTAGCHEWLLDSEGASEAKEALTTLESLGSYAF